MSENGRVLPEAPSKCACGNTIVWTGDHHECVQGHRRDGYAPPEETLKSRVRYDADMAKRHGRDSGSSRCDFCDERVYGGTWPVVGRDGITLRVCAGCLLNHEEEGVNA